MPGKTDYLLAISGDEQELIVRALESHTKFLEEAEEGCEEDEELEEALAHEKGDAARLIARFHNLWSKKAR